MNKRGDVKFLSQKVINLILGGLIAILAIVLIIRYGQVLYKTDACENQGDWLTLQADLEAIDKGLFNKKEDIQFNNQGCILFSYTPNKEVVNYITPPAFVKKNRAAICTCNPQIEQGKLLGECENYQETQCYFFEKITHINGNIQFTTIHDTEKLLFLNLKREGKELTIENPYGTSALSYDSDQRKKYEQKLEEKKIAPEVCFNQIERLSDAMSPDDIYLKKDILWRLGHSYLIGYEEDHLGECIVYHWIAEEKNLPEQELCHAASCQMTTNSCYMTQVRGGGVVISVEKTVPVIACKTCPEKPDCTIYHDAFQCAYDPCHFGNACAWINNQCAYDPNRDALAFVQDKILYTMNLKLTTSPEIPEEGVVTQEPLTLTLEANRKGEFIAEYKFIIEGPLTYTQEEYKSMWKGIISAAHYMSDKEIHDNLQNTQLTKDAKETLNEIQDVKQKLQESQKEKRTTEPILTYTFDPAESDYTIYIVSLYPLTDDKVIRNTQNEYITAQKMVILKKNE